MFWLSLLVVVSCIVGAVRAGLNYSDFAVVVDSGSFSSTGAVEDLVRDLSSR